MENAFLSSIPKQPTIAEQFSKDVITVYETIHNQMKSLNTQKQIALQKENKKNSRVGNLHADILNEERVLRKTPSAELGELFDIFRILKDDNYIYEDHFQVLNNSNRQDIVDFMTKYQGRLQKMIRIRELQFN